MTTTAAPPGRSQPPARPRRRRSVTSRIMTFVGLLLIVGGLALLGWFAWQYFGTNIVSKQKAAEITETTQAQWSNGIEGDAVALLRVERFGDDYEVPIVKGFDDASLAEGVGMYPDGVGPGEKGNFAIAAHRVTHGEPFRDFLELRTGDLVEVETRTKIYTYELMNDGDAITVDFTTSWPLWKVPNPDSKGEPPEKSYLTMLTCSELFHTRNRNVAIGELVDTVDKATTAPPADRAVTDDTEAAGG